MIRIAIQSGHENRTTGSTGAPGEQELTVRIRARLTELLTARGFQLYLFNADPKNDPAQAAILGNDYNLFLSLHGDADYAGDQGGGFADYPEPSTDGATTESQRICKVINDNYFPETQIKYVDHSNANTRYYYMWKYLSAKTPCVIIEMGQVQDPHDKVLLGNTELIANALARAICKAFGVSYEVAQPTPPPIESCETKLKAAQTEIDRLNKALQDAETSKKTELADMQSKCDGMLTSYKLSFITDLQKWLDAHK